MMTHSKKCSLLTDFMSVLIQYGIDHAPLFSTHPLKTWANPGGEDCSNPNIFLLKFPQFQ